jgi:hypothetical protein
MQRKHKLNSCDKRPPCGVVDEEKYGTQRRDAAAIYRRDNAAGVAYDNDGPWFHPFVGTARKNGT